MERVTRKTVVGALVFGTLLVLSACGGGSAASSSGQSQQNALPPPSESAVPLAEAREGGTARSGDQCDFGGAEQYTCGANLVCCYPPEGEVAYGTCVAECEGYD